MTLGELADALEALAEKEREVAASQVISDASSNPYVWEEHTKLEKECRQLRDQEIIGREDVFNDVHLRLRPA